MAIGVIETLDRGDGVKLAYQKQAGAGPMLVWFGGFASDMAGTKAEALAAWAEETGKAFLRFDYSGHGRSEGRFEEGTISRWRDDALAVLDRAGTAPYGFIGSSMGAWLALLAARARPGKVKGLLLLAPAPDFTEKLMWAKFPEAVRAQILESGRYTLPSSYDPERSVVTRALIEDGRKNLLLDAPYPFEGPTRIIQGVLDAEVPWGHALTLAQTFRGGEVHFDLVADGDHRLSRPQDIAQILAAAEWLSKAAS